MNELFLLFFFPLSFYFFKNTVTHVLGEVSLAMNFGHSGKANIFGISFLRFLDFLER